MRAFAVPLALFAPLLGLVLLSPTAAPVAPAAETLPEALPEQPQEPLVDRVNQAIEDGVEYLRSEENNGSWDQSGGHGPTGRTGLALLALLTAGVPPEDVLIQRGLAYLRKNKPTATYQVSLQTMVFALAGQEQDRDRVRWGADWLLKARGADGWGYSQTPVPADGSNTQYALLALHEAKRAGVPVDTEALKAVRAHYATTQNKDGGWYYKLKDPASTMTMTTAGLCGLLITGLDLDVGLAKLIPETGVATDCGKYAEEKELAAALRWMGEDDRFPSRLTKDVFARWAPLQMRAPYYALYGIERAGRLTGQRFIAGQDWYRLGCEFLVDEQKPARRARPTRPERRYWTRLYEQQLDADPIIATSFAVLFLSKGRTPVLLTKFARTTSELGNAEDWNRKHNDMRHLVDFASKELFKGQPLAWQNFDVRPIEAGGEENNRRLAEELLQSPIVWLSGHRCKISPREMAVLKEYVHNGGFIFAEACCGSPDFDADFRQVVKELFAESKSELVQLRGDHPIWSASGKFVSSPQDFPLWGVQEGCKTVLVYSPKPLAGYWEANALDGRGRKAFELGANVIAYGTGLEAPRPRLTEAKVVPPPDTEKNPRRRGALEVSELAHDGAWMWPAKAMPHLMKELADDGLDVVTLPSLVQLSSTVDLTGRPDALGPGQATVRDVRDGSFYYLHGRQAFHWDAQVEIMAGEGKKKVPTLGLLRFKLAEGGATLLADAACGSDEFDACFRKFIEALFEGKHKLVPIPLDDELFRTTNIKTVHCRRRSPDGKRVQPQPLEVFPELEGVKIDGRWVVIYSRYDLGCALEKHGTSSCLGHDYESAVKLARAAVLYHLRR
jgi:hypothetical protein